MTMSGEDTGVGEATMASRPPSGSVDALTFDREKAQRGVRLLLESMGVDPESEELLETWERRVPESLETLSEGYREPEKPTVRTFASENDELVVKTGIPIYSLCEHHLLPYHGTAHVAYRPDGEVAGLSKLVRYVRWQSRRLTIQEQLTQEIADGLAEEIGADAVIVEINATHFCEAMRGIETHTETRTLATAGSPTGDERRQFQDAITRAGGR